MVSRNFNDYFRILFINQFIIKLKEFLNQGFQSRLLVVIFNICYNYNFRNKLSYCKENRNYKIQQIRQSSGNQIKKYILLQQNQQKEFRYNIKCFHCQTGIRQYYEQNITLCNYYKFQRRRKKC
ncbi:hypothetical protein IMG5_093170 [Ichthyophthirius multifiliis]|uniref:Uncharacterized protein n=1 Tax=Ichthyophthirius multifiliis TaxID=5932 RepID=G0QRH8_ICHMU|nr:hypothetical protein IMG5_093170 [Ichthyophthirius multifiliis]EGR32177.1 hypothetical protein IMG5_093170 [Ichthyophthirius multifiliis]|eukprot:XP_004035663.1 hypothetical protein IMG5_093170 [Ichthyophthirius multifiliis]